MKAVQGNQKLVGGWDEDLEDIIGVLETMARMCSVTNTQILTSMSLMLSGDTLSFFSTNFRA